MSPKSFEQFATEQAHLKDSELIRLAEERGYVIHKPRPPESVADVDIHRIRGKRVKLGIVSDTHLGSKYQQLHFLREHYRLFRQEKVAAILHAGDVSDGPAEMHRGHQHNLFLQGYDAQLDYAAQHIPEVGIPQYFISGNHDDSHIKNAGAYIVKALAEKRQDITYLGESNGYVRVGGTLIHLVHPHKGGAYAWSYNLQKFIEAVAPERKASVVLMGNYHKLCHIDYRNMAGFVLPSYQSQTPFMASKGLASVVGGLILELGTVTKGLAPEISVRWLIEREPRADDF